jgi:uncharacterized membrane protein YdjX (TVP38/TMEM64 family)
MEMVNSKATDHQTSRLPLILSLSILAGLILSYFIFPGYKQGIDEAFEVLTSEDPKLIREWVSQFGAWGPVVLVLTMVFQMFLFFIPNILLILISILSYGPVWGGLVAWFGVVLASTVGYFIGNKLSPVIVHRLVSKKTQGKLREFIRDYGMKAIVVLRLSSFSNDGLSLVAGLLNMSYRRYIIATILGITPLITIVAIFGKNARIEKGLLWAGIVLVSGLVVYIILDRRRAKRKKT